MPSLDKWMTKTIEEEESPSLSSLPDEVAISCLARVSRIDHANLSLVSKRYKSLITSPEIRLTRSLLSCTETSLYVCLSILRDHPDPRWYILTRNRSLKQIPSHPDQASEASSFVVVEDCGIYVIGGLINDKPISNVLFLDCFSHKWRQVSSMNIPRASASASLVDGKIYVFGGCSDSSSNWAEVFDLKTQIWVNFITPMMSIHQSVVVDKSKVYAVDKEKQCFYFSPSESILWKSTGKIDSKPGSRKDWCSIGKLLFSLGSCGRLILWCEPDELDWKEVKGLEVLKPFLSDPCLNFGLPAIIHYRIIKLSSNSDGNIVIFWTKKLEIPSPESLEIWSMEIALERDEGGEIWGKIVWCNAVLKLDPCSFSFNKVLCSASVHV